MSYQDRWVDCQRCGRQFVFRVEEQRAMEQAGRPIVAPALCPRCRRTVADREPSIAQSKRVRPGGAIGPSSRTGDVLEGYVKWYSREKGYGFIVRPDGREVFFRQADISPDEAEPLAEGDRVTFTLSQTGEGLHATEVRRVRRGG